MTRHSDRIRLRQMLDHASEAIALIQGRRLEDLARDRVLELALTRLVEIIGEAAARTGEETRQLFPAIPWPQIIGMRNRLIHGYDQVDLQVLWNTITEDLPPLVQTLKESLNKLE